MPSIFGNVEFMNFLSLFSNYSHNNNFRMWEFRLRFVLTNFCCCNWHRVSISTWPGHQTNALW